MSFNYTYDGGKIMSEENKVCIQCGQPVMSGEEYCKECIIEDAKTMGVIE